MIKKEKIVIVIPFYHMELNITEKISLNQCIKILGDYDIVLVAPEKLRNNRFPIQKIKFVPDDWMESIDSYNRMMINPEFYFMFYKKYDYMLIYQLDALVFSDKLTYFCNLGYDYIGAPWFSGIRKIRNYERTYYYVGNGGFSLRRIRSFYNITSVEQIKDINIPEDLFWAYHKSEYFKIPDVHVAITFAMEEQVARSIKMNKGELPFGCHAWYKFDLEYLKPYLEKFDIDVSNIDSPRNDLYMGWNHKDLYDATDKDLKLVMGIPADEDIDIVLCGTGLYGEEAYALFKTIEVKNLVFADNNIAKCEQDFFGHRIELLTELLKSDSRKKCFVIAMGYKNSEIVKKQLEEFGYLFNKDIFYFYDISSKLSEKMEEEWFWDAKTSIKLDEISKRVENEKTSLLYSPK